MSDNPSDPFEFLKKLWAPMGLPTSGMGMPGMMFPSVDVGEIERRISDLRSVETWLSLNLEIVRTTVQALEAQRSTVQAFQAMHQSATDTAKAAMAGVASSTPAAGDDKPSATPAGGAPVRSKRDRKPT